MKTKLINEVILSVLEEFEKVLISIFSIFEEAVSFFISLGKTLNLLGKGKKKKKKK